MTDSAGPAAAGHRDDGTLQTAAWIARLEAEVARLRRSEAHHRTIVESATNCIRSRSGRYAYALLIILLAVLALSEPAHAQRTPPAASAPQFIEIDYDALLSSRLIGLNVQNADGEDLGKIEDVALQGVQLVGVILSVGEILGNGQRYIASIYHRSRLSTPKARTRGEPC